LVPSYRNPHAIRIPQQAVQELQGLKTVFVVAADGTVQARQISADQRSGNDWIVQNGMQPGEMVVAEGAGKVKAGAPVKPVLAQQPAAPQVAAPVQPAPTASAQTSAPAANAQTTSKRATPADATSANR